MASSYSDYADYILEMTGYDCSSLTDDQMDAVGMAAENAETYWEWAHADEAEVSKQYPNGVNGVTVAQQIAQAKSYTEGCETLKECLGAYVGGAWDSLGL